jgi:hypothetical protein
VWQPCRLLEFRIIPLPTVRQRAFKCPPLYFSNCLSAVIHSEFASCLTTCPFMFACFVVLTWSLSCLHLLMTQSCASCLWWRECATCATFCPEGARDAARMVNAGLHMDSMHASIWPPARFGCDRLRWCFTPNSCSDCRCSDALIGHQDGPILQVLQSANCDELSSRVSLTRSMVPAQHGLEGVGADQYGE